jgi:hypothetical protein
MRCCLVLLASQKRQKTSESLAPNNPQTEPELPTLICPGIKMADKQLDPMAELR